VFFSLFLLFSEKSRNNEVQELNLNIFVPTFLSCLILYGLHVGLKMFKYHGMARVKHQIFCTGTWTLRIKAVGTKLRIDDQRTIGEHVSILQCSLWSRRLPTSNPTFNWESYRHDIVCFFVVLFAKVLATSTSLCILHTSWLFLLTTWVSKFTSACEFMQFFLYWGFIGLVFPHWRVRTGKCAGLFTVTEQQPPPKRKSVYTPRFCEVITLM